MNQQRQSISLLGSAAADAVVATLVGCAPAAIVVWSVTSVGVDVTRLLTAGGAVLLLWGAFFGLSRFRALRIALAWTLALYSVLAIAILMHFAGETADLDYLCNPVAGWSPWWFRGPALGVIGFHAMALWRAHRREEWR